MNWLRNQWDDLKYLVSSENQTSRGFYLFAAVAGGLLVLALFITVCLYGYGVVTGRELPSLFNAIGG